MNTPTEPNVGRSPTGPGLSPDRPRDLRRSHNPIVAFLAREGRADRLLAEHVDDTNGHCAVCPAGPQRGRTTWPCSLANYAAAARDLAAGRPPTSLPVRSPLTGDDAGRQRPA